MDEEIYIDALLAQNSNSVLGIVFRLAEIVETLKQRPDELVAPTVSIPLIPALALFWEKAGIARGPALEMLKQALARGSRAGSHQSGQGRQGIEAAAACAQPKFWRLCAHFSTSLGTSRML